jgi:hypothetical protein
MTAALLELLTVFARIFDSLREQGRFLFIRQSIHVLKAIVETALLSTHEVPFGCWGSGYHLDNNSMLCDLHLRLCLSSCSLPLFIHTTTGGASGLLLSGDCAVAAAAALVSMVMIKTISTFSYK